MPSTSGKISKRVVDALKPHPSQDTFLWDEKLAGFGIRVKPSGSASYLVQYRNAHGRTRRLAFAKVGTLTPDQARDKAAKYLGDARDADPSTQRKEARKAMTVTELCDLYMAEVRSTPSRRGKIKKESTLAIDKGRIERHIKPLIGTKPVAGLKPADIDKLQRDVANGKTATSRPEKGRTGIVTGGPGAAARVIGLFGAILELAKRRGVITVNPARDVPKFQDKKRKRFLTAGEYTAIGKVLLELEIDKKNRTQAAALRMLMLTGCRRTEVLSLQWSEVDVQGRCFHLRDTKTGPQCRAVGATALKFVQDLPRTDPTWVFPAQRRLQGEDPSQGSTHLIGLPKFLDRVLERAKVADVTLHTLRHSFASTAAAMGYSELVIAGLLGHAARGVTQDYAHIADAALVTAANAVSARIQEMLSGKTKAHNIVPMTTPVVEVA